MSRTSAAGSAWNRKVDFKIAVENTEFQRFAQSESLHCAGQGARALIVGGRVGSEESRSPLWVDAPTSAPARAVLCYSDLNPARQARLSASLRAAGFTVARRTDAVPSPREPIEIRVRLLGLESSDLRAAPSLAEEALTAGPKIAFAEGLHLWPLAVKARLLLAGFSKLVDTSRNELEDIHTSIDAVVGQLRRAVESRQSISEQLRAAGFVGESPAMAEIAGSVLRLASVGGFPVLITGETGTGKERVARALHALDAKRNRHHFVAVNCAAIPDRLAESELFGHRRGSFTGAGESRKGFFREADGGVLFLDEIAEMPLPVQAKLLRVLQDSKVRGVGEPHDEKVDVRVIAATNRDLRSMVANGAFRSDLFYRLNVLTLDLPPLRNRPQDIKALAAHFCHLHSPSCGHPQPVSLSSEFVEALCSLRLAGNARELENLIRYALVRCTGPQLGIEHLPVEVICSLRDSAQGESADSSSATLDATIDEESYGASVHRRDEADASTQVLNLAQVVLMAERTAIRRAMRKAGNNRSKAAKLLGISARCMYNKLLGLELD